MGFSPYFLMYGRKPHLPIDVSLGLAPNSVAMPTSTTYVQKLRDCIRRAHRKADWIQQKEVWCHNQNYDKCSRAVALKEGVTVLVCVTTSRDDRDTKLVGEQGKYSGTVAISQFASLHGMP